MVDVRTTDFIAKYLLTGRLVLDVFRDDFQIETVKQGSVYLILWIVQVGHFIGGCEKTDGCDGNFFALIGIDALVECGEQRVQCIIIRFKNLIEQNKVRLRDFACRQNRRPAAVQHGQRFAQGADRS